VSCTTQQTTAPSLIDGDIYTGTESVKYLADGVADQVFFATNKYNISSRGIDTLAKQVNYLKNNPNLNVSLEGHADERGTREYNLALGEKRANIYFYLWNIKQNEIRVTTLTEYVKRAQKYQNDISISR
jgi:peptidoglycan-associated lipoprotein